MSQSQPPSAGPSTGQQLSIFQRLFFWGSSPAGPVWDPKIKRFQTLWLLRLVVVILVAVTAAVIYWVIIQDIVPAAVKPLPAGVELAVVLAPVLAAAASVERFLETLFGILEANWRSLIAYLGRGLRWLQNAETEVESARQWLIKVSAEYTLHLQTLSESKPGETQDPRQLFKAADERIQDAKKLMDLAEQRVKMAEDQLSQVTSSDHYRNTKRAVAIYLGLLLGLIVATAGSLQMFAMMGINVGNPKIDVIVTGLVIGSGSAPVHSLINILQSAKEALDSAGDWLQSAKKKT